MMKKPLSLILSSALFAASMLPALPAVSSAMNASDAGAHGGRALPGVRAAGAIPALPAAAPAMGSSSWAPVGAAQGFHPQQSPEPSLPPGIEEDLRTPPPGSATTINILHSVQTSAGGSAPIILNADPNNLDSVEAALRKWVDANPKDYGAPSSQMVKISVQRMWSQGGSQGTTIVARFVQAVEGKGFDGKEYALPVKSGGMGNITFVLRTTSDNKLTVVDARGRMFAGVTGDIMRPGGPHITADYLLAQARKRVQSSDPSQSLTVDGPEAWREINNDFGGKWRAMVIFLTKDVNGNPIAVGVDEKTGEAFLSSDRTSSWRNSASGDIVGSVLGNAAPSLTAAGDVAQNVVAALTLPFVNIYDGANIVAVTDQNGNFTIPASPNGSAARNVTIRLQDNPSPFVSQIQDQGDYSKAPDASFSFQVTPGTPQRLVLNASSLSQNFSQIVALSTLGQHRAFVLNLPGIKDDPIMQRKLRLPLAGIIVNSALEVMNAFYSGLTNTVNFMRAGTFTATAPDGTSVTESAVSTDRQDVGFHELTHSSINSAALPPISDDPALAEKNHYLSMHINAGTMVSMANESMADAVSNRIRNAENIGAGLIPNPPAGMSDGRRDESKVTKYDPNAEAHNGVFAEMLGAFDAAIQAAMPGGRDLYDAALGLMFYTQPSDVVAAAYHIFHWLGDHAMLAQWVQIAGQAGINLPGFVPPAAPPAPPVQPTPPKAA